MKFSKIFLNCLIFCVLFVFPPVARANSYESAINPVIVTPTPLREAPRVPILENENKAPRYFSNNIDNSSNQITCKITYDIQQTYEPKKEKKCDENGENCTETFVPYNADKIEQNKTSNKLSNSNFRDSDIYYAKNPPLDPEISSQDKNKVFKSFKEDGLNVSTRSMPYSYKLYLKGKLIENIFAFLKEGKDVPEIDEQIAWDCAGQCTGLYGKDGKTKPSGCRPVYISEIGCFFNGIKGDSTSYKLENNRAIKIPFPYSIAGCSAPMSEDCYTKLYQNMPLVTRGTVNTRMTVYVREGEEGAETPTPYDKAYPLVAAIGSTNVANVAKMFIPKKQKIIDDSQTICQDKLPQDPIQDEPSPVNFLTYWIGKVFKVIKDVPETISAMKDGGKEMNMEVTWPKSAIENITTDEAFNSNIIPQKEHQQFDFKNMAKSSVLNQDGIDYPDPGYRDSQMRKKVYQDLRPASWSKTQTSP